MTLTDIKQFGANVKKLADHARATGPKSPEGKARSAINAVKHGMAAQPGLLLPGEDSETYEKRMDAVFEALAPADEAQARLAALVGDDLHNLDRLARIEKGVTLGRIEELLGMTHSAAKAKRTANALMALGTALRSWEAQPFPTERGTEFSRRLQEMSEAIDLVAAVAPEISADAIESCNGLLLQLFGKSGEKAVPMNIYSAVFKEAGKVMSALIQRGERDEAAQDELRKAIADIALPDEGELRKLCRYRRMLEESVGRRLEILNQLRRWRRCPPRRPSGRESIG